MAKEIKPLNVPVRFFVWDLNETEEVGVHECDEAEFNDAEGEICYERHTMRENGVSQICLTKTNGW